VSIRTELSFSASAPPRLAYFATAVRHFTPRRIAVLASGVGLVLPRSNLEHALGVVLLLESPKTLHGFFRKDPPHFVFVLGHGVVEIRRHVKRFQRFDEAVAPLLAGGAFAVVGPADDSRAPQASAASAK